MAAKVSRIPSATSHTPNSRIPGVSMRNTPVHIDELPMRGGVPSLAVKDAYLPGAHDLLPDQCVHQGGFANAGRAE